MGVVEQFGPVKPAGALVALLGVAALTVGILASQNLVKVSTAAQTALIGGGAGALGGGILLVGFKRLSGIQDNARDKEGKHLSREITSYRWCNIPFLTYLNPTSSNPKGFWIVGDAPEQDRTVDLTSAKKAGWTGFG